jgi:hypothetical protein
MGRCSPFSVPRRRAVFSSATGGGRSRASLVGFEKEAKPLLHSTSGSNTRGMDARVIPVDGWFLDASELWTAREG